MEILKVYALILVLAPLIGGITAGVFGRKIGKRWSHSVTIAGVAISFIFALLIAKNIFLDGTKAFDGTIYTWAVSGSFTFNVGFLIDNLSSLMMLTVTFVSLCVHIFSIGYMAEDAGYQRFFSYMSLFTFFMLCLVLANNFLLLYFGWEGVGLVSYLLIGFWFKKESANQGSLKAFLANRVGDAGFLLGIAALITYFGTVNYHDIFAMAAHETSTTITVFGAHWNMLTVACILLFIGAMGKSAQMPLHVWLPESMEGPTPISALIHAATMVTAGVYMVTRISPIPEWSPTARSVILIIGASTCLFMGILGIIQNDIKRVIAYSTLSQLGYMVAALGASAYAAGMFHLMTHAAFKALLFLAAGSVILGMHHEQDMRKMGGLWKYMPVTYITFLVGAFALVAMPPFSGFYSKDTIIEAIGLSGVTGASYAYYCVLACVFVTAVYTFRAFFMTFHTKEKFDDHTRANLKESPWVVRLPLIALSIPAAVLGAFMIFPGLYAKTTLFGKTIFVLPKDNVLAQLGVDFHGAFAMALHAFTTVSFWLMILGIATAYVFTTVKPNLGGVLKQKFSRVYFVLEHKYGFDAFNDLVFVRGTIRLAKFLFYVCDMKFIDDIVVNGSGRAIGFFSRIGRRLQTGYLYHYTFVMVIGLMLFLIWVLYK